LVINPREHNKKRFSKMNEENGGANQFGVTFQWTSREEDSRHKRRGDAPQMGVARQYGTALKALTAKALNEKPFRLCECS
jgi:hypothetical protein